MSHLGNFFLLIRDKLNLNIRPCQILRNEPEISPQAYESSHFEVVEDGQKSSETKVLGHISVGDGMVGTITLIDPQQQQHLLQEEEVLREKKKKVRAPYQTQFANLNLTAVS